MTLQNPPLVSLILPTKNSRRFLDERIASIRDQSLTDYEVIAVDSHSEDGTAEIIENWSREDSRVQLHQVPPGLYKAWNYGIRQARGKYVYIATSDDTMTSDCLELMVSALEENPGCSICDSLLEMIDEKGEIISEGHKAYLPLRGHFDFPLNKKHIRHAPHDFWLYAGGKTVYTSLTQVLIRRELFEEMGFFEENMGPTADYLWGLRASLKADVIFLPRTLSFWRQHSTQATGHSPEFQNYSRIARMLDLVRQEIQDPAIKRRMAKFVRLVDLKVILLPVKRSFSLKNLLTSLFKAGIFHPVLSLKFFFYVLQNRKNPFKFIVAYDKLLLDMACKPSAGKVVEI